MDKDLKRVEQHWKTDRETEELEALSLDEQSDEYWFARQMLSLARTGAMFHGRFVEVHVARLLGAHLPKTGVSPWDLLVPGKTPIWVEVKTTTGPTPSFTMSTKSVKEAGDRDIKRVWIFVHAADRESRDFTYYVASHATVYEAVVGGTKSKTIRVDDKRLGFREVRQAHELSERVREAAGL